MEAITSELRGDAKIRDLWRMSKLFPTDVREQTMMRLDEIGKNYENLQAKAVSFTTNKTEEA